MGQKIIPISLRLNKRKNWESNWIINKEEYSLFFFLDIELRKYFYKIFNNKLYELVNFNFKKVSKNINLYLYLNDKTKIIKKKKIKIIQKNIYRIIKILNNYYKNYYFKIFIQTYSVQKNIFIKNNISEICNFIKKNNQIKLNYNNKQVLYTIFYSLYFKNIDIILILFKKILEKRKIHKGLIFNLNNILCIFFNLYSNILGYKIQFKGRLNGSKRKQKLTYNKGKIPLNVLKYDIKYSFNNFKTPSGICSIKLWIFFKNTNKIKNKYVINK